MNDWATDDAVQRQRIDGLATDLKTLERHLDQKGFVEEFPWDDIFRWADRELGLEAREMVVSLLIEGHSDIVDHLESDYRVDESERFRIYGSRRISDVLALVDRFYDWTARYDFTVPSEAARFWYTSEEKLEPRLGERWLEEGASLEQPLAIARDVQALRESLIKWPQADSLAAFLLVHPEHRHTVRRVLLSEHAPYSEIRDNVISSDMRPIDILRFKLSFFGATRFDPKSDRWLRITMFQHAPCMDEIATADVDDWFLPPADSRTA